MVGCEVEIDRLILYFGFFAERDCPARLVYLAKFGGRRDAANRVCGGSAGVPSRERRVWGEGVSVFWPNLGVAAELSGEIGPPARSRRGASFPQRGMLIG